LQLICNHPNTGSYRAIVDLFVSKKLEVKSWQPENTGYWYRGFGFLDVLWINFSTAAQGLVPLCRSNK
jgi:hypothetical protein